MLLRKINSKLRYTIRNGIANTKFQRSTTYTTGRTSKDPIDLYTGVVLERKFATQAEIDHMRASVGEEIKEAVTFAESSPEPSITTITQGVDSGKLGVQL